MNERNLDGLRTDLATVEQVVRDYDAQIDRGPAYFNDDQLRRIWNFRQYRGDRIRLCKFQKILDPSAMPLIAIREFILSRKSLGGIQTDLGCRVLRGDGSPIDGPLRRRRGGGLRRRRHPRHGLAGRDVPRRAASSRDASRHARSRERPYDEDGQDRREEDPAPGSCGYALEQLPVTHTFGIPGVHNTEIYDELSRSEKIQPVLVTHEAGAAFAADGISRTSGGTIGTLVIVPAAGLTHAMSGIGEAFLDGIPMLVISGGTRTDVPFRYQLHELDQHAILKGLTKGSWQSEDARRDRAHDLRGVPHGGDGRARPGVRRDPGEPAALPGRRSTSCPPSSRPRRRRRPEPGLLDAAVDLLENGAVARPLRGVGRGRRRGRRGAHRRAARRAGATTLQGLSAFSGNSSPARGHGLLAGGGARRRECVPDCDCLLAIGTRFAEIPTGSFGCSGPRGPDPRRHRSGGARRELPGEGRDRGRRARGRARASRPPRASAASTRPDRRQGGRTRISSDKQAYREEWLRPPQRPGQSRPVSSTSLRRQLADDALMVVDDGNHTFLAAELFAVAVPRARSFARPTSTAWATAVPAAIGAKLANPDAGRRHRRRRRVPHDRPRDRDGRDHQAGVVFFVFHDGELSQISQGQEIPYNRKTCTVLGEIRLEGVALATGAAFVPIADDAGIDGGDSRGAGVAGTGQPVVVDVRIDYWQADAVHARASSRRCSSASRSATSSVSSAAPSCGK